MDPGVKEDKTIQKARSTCFNLSVAFLLLNVSNFIVPATGFALRTCRISRGNAVCKPLDDETTITAVPQDIPSTVKGLDLSGNKISKIGVSDFKDFPVLIQLDLKANWIKNIESGAFAELSSLQWLNLSNNKLSTLGDDFFYGLTNLTELRIRENQISLVAPTSFKSLTSLNVLDISNNKLFNLAEVRSIIQHLPNLQVLYVQGNRLTDFHSWQLTNSSLGLTSLDLSKNPFAVFMMTADIFPNLTCLGVGHPKLKTWDVRNKTFLSRVSTLDISGLHLKLDVMKALLEGVNSSLTFLTINDLDCMEHRNFSAIMNIACSIPTMSKIQLRQKNCESVRVTSGWFQLCVNVTELDLAQNNIQDIQAGAFSNIQGLRILDLSRNRLPSVPAATGNLPSLVQLDLSNNNITGLGCLDFANLTKLTHLYLYQNSISALQECLFKDLIQLQVLKLQENTIRTLGGTFSKSFPNLRQLYLNFNFLPYIKPGEFQGLRSLYKLSLQENLIKKIYTGCFIGLTNLTEIQLQSNKIQDLKQEFFNDLTNLRKLDLSNNHIRYENSSDLPHPPFCNLSRLETLALYAQHHRGRFQLPSNILQGLTNLTIFNMRNMRLFSLPNDIFRFTPQLQKLDMRSNDLEDFPPDLFFPIQNLKSLYLSTTNLHSLDFLINANLSNLELFEAKKNSFSVLREEVMKSLPALSYLDLQGNGFICDCDNTWFIQWAKQDNQTQVYDAYGYKCNYPSELKGKKLLDFDIESCSVNIDFICFVSTTCTILLFMVVSFSYHFLRWQLAYAYYFFLALLVDAKNKNRDTANQYDAFISYNTHDEPWVIRELMPKLEGEQGWRLCLHHRDFEPGKPIVDNITDAIYGSRKTICVISRRYLESEWCSREMQVASFRLFDEQKDVLILVFLEEIPTYQLSPYYRMRKLLKRKTYLSWPRAGENTKIFWEKLRQALKTREHLGEDKTLHNVVDRQYP